VASAKALELSNGCPVGVARTARRISAAFSFTCLNSGVHGHCGPARCGRAALENGEMGRRFGDLTPPEYRRAGA